MAYCQSTILWLMFSQVGFRGCLPAQPGHILLSMLSSHGDAYTSTPYMEQDPKLCFHAKNSSYAASQHPFGQEKSGFYSFCTGEHFRAASEHTKSEECGGNHKTSQDPLLPGFYVTNTHPQLLLNSIQKPKDWALKR